MSVPRPIGDATAATGEVTREGMWHIQGWLSAREGMERAEKALQSARTDFANAEAKLAKWLMPADMKPGEKIAIWAGDSLFQVELEEQKSYPADENGEPIVSYKPKVTVRSRGKHFGDLR